MVQDWQLVIQLLVLVVAGLLPVLVVVGLLARAVAGRSTRDGQQQQHQQEGAEAEGAPQGAPPGNRQADNTGPSAQQGTAVPDAVQAILDICRAGGPHAARSLSSPPCPSSSSALAAAIDVATAAAGGGTVHGTARDKHCVAGPSYPPPRAAFAGDPSTPLLHAARATAEALDFSAHGARAVVTAAPMALTAEGKWNTKTGLSAIALSAAIAAARPPPRSQAASYSGGGGSASNSSSLKAPVGLSRCTIVEDAPYPPPNTQVVMELQERTLHVRGRRLRYRGYRPADRTLPLPLHPPPQDGAPAACGTARAGEQAAPLPATAEMQPGPPHQPQPHPHPYWDSHAPARYPATALVPVAAATAGMATAPAGCPHHHLSLSIKLPWAHPSALSGVAGSAGGCGGGGLLESLNEALASGSGYMVVGAAVRPGCMLLQLELLAVDSSRRGGRGGGLGGSRRRLLPYCEGGVGGDGGVAAEGKTGGRPQPAAGWGSGGEEDGDAAQAAASVQPTLGPWAGTAADAAAARPQRRSPTAALAEQLAAHMAQLLPPPAAAAGGAAEPDAAAAAAEAAGEVVICLGGHLSYAVSYDEAAAAWIAERDPAQGGRAGMALLRRLGGARGVRMRAAAGGAAVAVGQAAAGAAVPAAGRQAQWGDGTATDAAAAGAAAAAPAADSVTVAVMIWVADDAAAAVLVERLKHLMVDVQAGLEAGDGEEERLGESQEQKQRQHVAADEWQVVANCLGRSLPLEILEVDLQVPPPSSSASPSPSRGGGAAAVSLRLSVRGAREALEAACCRLAVLSVELWCGGVYEVAQAPVMLVLDPLPQPPSPLAFCSASAAPPPPGGGSVRAAPAAAGGGGSGGEQRAGDAVGAGVAAALVAELNGLAASTAVDSAAVAAAEGSACSGLCDFPGGRAHEAEPGAFVEDSEAQQDVQQVLSDMGMFELYAASQRLNQDGFAAGGGGQPDCDDAATAAAAAAAPPPPPLLPGSVDMCAGLQRLLSSPDPEQRRTMLLTGANLLSYAVLRGMLHTAAAVRGALLALGVGLAEADAMSAASAADAGLLEDEALGTLITSSPPAFPRDEGDFPYRMDSHDHSTGEPCGEGGLPLVALSVLSGNLEMVRLVLRWAEEEGLGRGWVLRRHRGRSPVQLAAMSAWDASGTARAPAGDRGSGGGGGGGDGEDLGVWAAYLARVEQLLLRAGVEPEQGQAQRLAGKGEDDVVEMRWDRDQGAAAQPGQRGGDDAAPEPRQSRQQQQQQPRREGSAAAPWHPAAPPLTPVATTGTAPAPDRGAGAARPSAKQAPSGAAHAGPPGPAAAGAAAAATARRRSVGAVGLRVCLLGYPDPATEAAYRSFTLPLEAHVSGCWALLMCAALVAALLRQPLRGGTGGGGAGGGAGGWWGGGGDAAEVPAALAFAWPYVALAAGLALAPSATLRRLRQLWLLCGVARMSVKALFAAGLLSTPRSMLAYTRRGVTLVTDIILPGLCERAIGKEGLAIRALEALAFAWFARSAGLASSVSAAALQALCRAALYLGCALTMEACYRMRFEAAHRSGGGGNGGGSGGGGSAAAGAQAGRETTAASVAEAGAAAVGAAVAAGACVAAKR